MAIAHVRRMTSSGVLERLAHCAALLDLSQSWIQQLKFMEKENLWKNFDLITGVEFTHFSAKF